VTIAEELRAAGDDCRFVVHSASTPVVAAAGFPFDELTPHMNGLSRMYIEACIESERPDSVVLCDFHGCANYFLRRDIDPMFLWAYGVPVLALDIWNSAETDCDVDLFGEASKPRATGIDRVAGRLVPVPFGRPTAEAAYRALGTDAPLRPAARAAVRRGLGLDQAPVVLFCTADWQHQVQNARGRRLQHAVPEILWRYLRQIDEQIRLLHVGPAPLSLSVTDDRYLWRPSLPPETFTDVLGTVDFVLSANISATTNARAVAAGVPVIVVQNSYSGDTLEEIEATAPAPISPAVRELIAGALPWYSFSLWPLGYRQYLAPLLRDNPYCSVVEVVEILDEPRFVSTGRQLIFDTSARDGAKDRMSKYVARVGELPTAGQLINQYLN